MNEQFVIIVHAPETNKVSDLSGFVVYGPYDTEAEAESVMASSHWDIDLRAIVLAELKSPTALLQRAAEEGLTSG